MLLIIVLLAIIGSIFYFESTKPKIDNTPINAEIKIEESFGGDNYTESSEKILSELDTNRIISKSEKYERAKELVGPEGFINVDNITISENIGKKVILVDFWTYSCINCQRTLPYLTSWYEKYKDDGLLIIGVHTPEFEFEKDYENVVAATKKWDVTYPVVQDNDRQTWRAYKNRYWPRKYLIDIDGFIVFDHIGEGAYEKTEKLIQHLLKERSEVLNIEEEVDSDVVVFDSDKGSSKGRTKEVYFGYKFSREQLGNTKGWQPDKIVDYSIPKVKEKDLFYLDGSWKNNKDNMEFVGDKGMIHLAYFAKQVNIVAGSINPVNVEVFLDGEKVKNLTVQEFDLYNLISSEESDGHVLELKTEMGLMAYTFTFG